LTRLRDTQIAGKSLFLGISVRIFPKGIRILISEQSKENSHSLNWIALSNQLTAWTEEKGQGKVDFSSLSHSSGDIIPFFSCPWISELQVLWPLDSRICISNKPSSVIYHQLLWF
jgi:hypothetical protein